MGWLRLVFGILGYHEIPIQSLLQYTVILGPIPFNGMATSGVYHMTPSVIEGDAHVSATPLRPYAQVHHLHTVHPDLRHPRWKPRWVFHSYVKLNHHGCWITIGSFFFLYSYG